MGERFKLRVPEGAKSEEKILREQVFAFAIGFKHRGIASYEFDQNGRCDKLDLKVKPLQLDISMLPQT